MRLILILCGSLLLTGCFHQTTKPDIEVKFIYPPSSYLQSCYPSSPAFATIEDIIVIQNRALDQCNDQLTSLREWVDEQKQINSTE